LEPFAVRLVRDLGHFLLTTSEDTLVLVLETISSMFLVNVAKWLDTDLAKSLVVAILQVWNRNNKGNETD
jgi:importin-9